MLVTAPPVIEAKPFTRIPKELELSGRASGWADRMALRSARNQPQAAPGVRLVCRALRRDGDVLAVPPSLLEAAVVSGCVKPRINGEQRSPLAVILGAGGDSERRVGV